MLEFLLAANVFRPLEHNSGMLVSDWHRSNMHMRRSSSPRNAIHATDHVSNPGKRMRHCASHSAPPHRFFQFSTLSFHYSLPRKDVPRALKVHIGHTAEREPSNHLLTCPVFLPIWEHFLQKTIHNKMKAMLSDSAKDAIRISPHKIPGCVDRAGKTLFSDASGEKGIDTKEPMTLDMVFWIAPCTKMIACIAAMHSVEQGRLALDGGDLVERYCPELRTVRILKGVDDDGKAETVPKKNRTTLRMLLNHTGMASNLCNVVFICG